MIEYTPIKILQFRVETCILFAHDSLSSQWSPRHPTPPLPAARKFSMCDLQLLHA